MSQKIYKYELNLGLNKIEVSKYHEVLTAQIQGGKLVVWIKVDPDLPQDCTITFDVVGTGHKLADDNFTFKYLSTVQEASGILVWHIFYREGL